MRNSDACPQGFSIDLAREVCWSYHVTRQSSDHKIRVIAARAKDRITTSGVEQISGRKEIRGMKKNIKVAEGDPSEGRCLI